MHLTIVRKLLGSDYLLYNQHKGTYAAALILKELAFIR